MSRGGNKFQLELIAAFFRLQSFVIFGLIQRRLVLADSAQQRLSLFGGQSK
jgi:hypothetical protein